MFCQILVQGGMADFFWGRGGRGSDGGFVKTSTAGMILHDCIMLLCWRFPNAALQMVGKTALKSGKYVYLPYLSQVWSLWIYVEATHWKCCHTLPRCPLPTTNIDFLEICSCFGLASYMPCGMVRWTDLGPICTTSTVTKVPCFNANCPKQTHSTPQQSEAWWSIIYTAIFESPLITNAYPLMYCMILWSVE